MAKSSNAVILARVSSKSQEDEGYSLDSQMKLLTNYFNKRNQKVALVLSVWAVLFVSKFVFLWILDFIFGNYLDITGFVGLFIIILVATILQKIVDYFYNRFSTQIT